MSAESLKGPRTLVASPEDPRPAIDATREEVAANRPI